MEKCLPKKLSASIHYGVAEKAENFLKLLDDPLARRKSLIFVTHGALSRGLNDKWVMLALIYQALKGRRGVDNLRRPFSRFVGDIIYLKHANRAGEDFWMELLKSHPSLWRGILHKWEIDPEGDNNPTTDDDPVPKAVWEILPQLDTNLLYEYLKTMPRRRSKKFYENMTHVRNLIRPELKKAWDICLLKLRLSLPLLILDEAHRLKNAQTRLAKLFQDSDSSNDADAKCCTTSQPTTLMWTML